VTDWLSFVPTRQDTAFAIEHLATKLFDSPNVGQQKLPPELRLLDLCSGSGCIPLLFRHEFWKRSNRRQNKIRQECTSVTAVGVDISPNALDLARENNDRLEYLVPTEFLYADVLTGLEKESSGKKKINEEQQDIKLGTAETRTSSGRNKKKSAEPAPPLQEILQARGQERWDILTANPPYISPYAFNHSTSRSVRRFEPKTALVPPALLQVDSGVITDPGDVFYPSLLRHAQFCEAQIVLFEISELSQAVRVARMMKAQGLWAGIQIWRDVPWENRPGNEQDLETVEGFQVFGAGEARSVICFTNVGKQWLKTG